MHRFIEAKLALSAAEAVAYRRALFLKHGTTGFGLWREHGVALHEFFDHVQDDPSLEKLVQWQPQDWRALAALPGRKVLITNAQRGYTERVLRTIGKRHVFERVVCFNDMQFAGNHRPKPDTRMLLMLCASLKIAPTQVALVEDTLGHLKAARAIGMRTVLIKRYSAHAKAVRGRPAFLHARINAISGLTR